MPPHLMRLFTLCLPAFLPTLAYAAQPGQSPTPAPLPMQSAQPNPTPTATAVATPTAAASPTPLPAARPFTVTGKRVVFYSDRFVVTADENVVVTLADGTRITGNTFMMHLKLNRFVIAGDVRVRTKAGQVIPGAAFAEYFDFDRAYFVPITTEPDRWTFVGNDFEKPLRGREMPGDTFFLPDLSNEHVFLYGGKALIAPRESVRFTPASINLNFVGNKPAAFVPTPSYYFNFSSNPNFAQNGLAGAYFDAPYPIAGGAHGSATAHLRYDEINQLYLSYEQHLAITDKSYLVLSANPLTRPQRQYNLLAMDHVSPKIQTQLFVQENVFQLGLAQPLSAGAFSQLKTTVGLHHSFLQWNLDNLWESLLANPCPKCAPPQALVYGLDHIWIPDHGSDSQLSWTGFDHRIARTVPLSYRLRSGIGFVHDSYAPPGSLGGESYPTIWQHFVGFTLFTPSLIIKTAPFRSWHVNAVFDKQRQGFSEPHHVDTTQTTITASKTFDKHVSAYIGYAIANTGDFFGSLQAQAYPSQVPVSPITGQSFPGYAAFDGFATTRSLSESLIWTPSQNLTLNLIWRENHDFPVSVPYMAAPLAFGQSLGNNQQADLGVSPQQLTGDLRIRLRPNLLVDLTRSYYFNWGNRRWTPQFTFLISK